MNNTGTVDTVEIMIVGLETSISDKQFCENLESLLQMRGICTREPSIDHIDPKHDVVTFRIFGTVATGAINRCIAHYLDDWLNPDKVSYTSFRIASS